VTWTFCYLVIFLVGFTLALVGGLVRRLLHPCELADRVIVPSHEHWASLRTPRADLVVSFLTGFGASGLVVHGTAHLDTRHELAAAAGGGIVLAALVRWWMCREVKAPADPAACLSATATVVREIPPRGFGQVEVEVHGCRVKLAARTEAGRPIGPGETVRVVDRQESVLVVAPER